MATPTEIRNRPAPTRQNNRSTRSTRSTRAAKPAAKKGQTAAEYAAELQAKRAAKQGVTMIRTEAPVRTAPQRADVRKNKKQAEPDTPVRKRPSTRRVVYTEPPKRIEIFTEKRQQSKFEAPLKFAAILFGSVVVSVVAFGLLRGDPPVPTESAEASPPQTIVERDANGNPLFEVLKFESPGSTSTNTGILRGSESHP